MINTRVRMLVTGVAMTVIALTAMAAPAQAAPAGPSNAAPAGGAPIVNMLADSYVTILPSDTGVLYNSDGRAEYFWIGSTSGAHYSGGALIHQYIGTNGSLSAPESLGGQAYDSFCGARNADGRLEIFVKALGKDVNHKWQVKAGSGWSVWDGLGGTVKAGQGVYCTSLSGARIGIRVLGPDNLQHYKYQQSPNGDWTPNWM